MKRIWNTFLFGLLVWLLVLSAAAAPLPMEGEVSAQAVDTTQVWLMGELPTMEDLRTSKAGLDFIKAHEGYVSSPYDDYTQQTIGYGCNVDFAKKYGFDPEYLTRSEAHDLLVCVVWEFEQKLDDFLYTYDITLTEAYQYDALISFTFNSPGWLNPDYRISRLLRSSVYTENELASAWGIWCHAGGEILNGLVSRRMDEITLFLYGEYAAEEPRFCTLTYRGEGTIDNDIEFFRKGEPYGRFTAVVPLREGLAFDGWYTEDGMLLEADDIVEESHVVTVRWRQIYGYEVTALDAWASDGTVLDGIPENGFYLTAEIYKSEGTGSSVLFLATYTDRGQMLDTYFLKADVPEGTSYSLGVWVDNTDGAIGECRAFVLESMSSAVPLCKEAVLN